MYGADGDPDVTDCDDFNPNIPTLATEICDGLDNDCSGAPEADEVDADMDGQMICGGDCDDNDASLTTLDLDGDGSVTCPSYPVCYELDMVDSYGDGWNGGSLTINEDGDWVGQYSVPSWNSSSTQTFCVDTGATVSLSYSSGIWEAENSYQLVDPDGAIVFSDGAPPFGPPPIPGQVYSEVACD